MSYINDTTCRVSVNLMDEHCVRFVYTYLYIIVCLGIWIRISLISITSNCRGGHSILADIAAATILIPSHVGNSLQLIWRCALVPVDSSTSARSSNGLQWLDLEIDHPGRISSKRPQNWHDLLGITYKYLFCTCLMKTFWAQTHQRFIHNKVPSIHVFVYLNILQRYLWILYGPPYFDSDIKVLVLHSLTK